MWFKLVLCRSFTVFLTNVFFCMTTKLDYDTEYLFFSDNCIFGSILGPLLYYQSYHFSQQLQFYIMFEILFALLINWSRSKNAEEKVETFLLVATVCRTRYKYYTFYYQCCRIKWFPLITQLNVLGYHLQKSILFAHTSALLTCLANKMLILKTLLQFKVFCDHKGSSSTSNSNFGGVLQFWLCSFSFGNIIKWPSSLGNRCTGCWIKKYQSEMFISQ